MCTISGQLADRRMCNAGVKFTKAALANQFGAGNADAALSFAAASVTLTGSVSGAVNRASPPLSITASSVFVVQQLVCSNNAGVNQCHAQHPHSLSFSSPPLSVTASTVLVMQQRPTTKVYQLHAQRANRSWCVRTEMLPVQ